MCSHLTECVLTWQNVFSCDRVCSHVTECVLMWQSVFFCDRMCSLTQVCGCRRKYTNVSTHVCTYTRMSRTHTFDRMWFHVTECVLIRVGECRLHTHVCFKHTHLIECGFMWQNMSSYETESWQTLTWSNLFPYDRMCSHMIERVVMWQNTFSVSIKIGKEVKSWVDTIEYDRMCSHMIYDRMCSHMIKCILMWQNKFSLCLKIGQEVKSWVKWMDAASDTLVW